MCDKSAAQRIRAYLEEESPDTLLADGLDGALIGIGEIPCHSPIAVYDRNKCITEMMASEGWEYEEAVEYLEFNTFCAYVGKHTPIFVTLAEDLIDGLE